MFLHTLKLLAVVLFSMAVALTANSAENALLKKKDKDMRAAITTLWQGCPEGYKLTGTFEVLPIRRGPRGANGDPSFQITTDYKVKCERTKFSAPQN